MTASKMSIMIKRNVLSTISSLTISMDVKDMLIWT